MPNDQRPEETASAFRDDFLWGAATAAHQVEGNNLNCDWWKLEHDAADFGVAFSGDALDSYHRYAEDMHLLADAGFNAYRFSIEWARIEPSRGRFSRAELAHYRRMIDTAIGFGLTRSSRSTTSPTRCGSVRPAHGSVMTPSTCSRGMSKRPARS